MADPTPLTPVPLEIDPRFHREHWRLARAACLRISAACPKGRPITWMLRTDGFLGVEIEQTWEWVSEEYGDEGAGEPFRCGIVLSDSPETWQRELDQTPPGGHLVIVGHFAALTDSARWQKTRLRPHALIVGGYHHVAALVTAGRWPSDRMMRLILL